MAFYLKKSSVYKDVIHDMITTTIITDAIINTYYFNRLRYLKQLGNMYFVFPTCNGTRFEHSLGTYYLSGLFIENLIKNSEVEEINKPLMEIEFIKNYCLKKNKMENTEENIDILRKSNVVLMDNYLIELIKIAGLCHDLGHGPYSHLFDDWLIGQDELKNCKMIHHEYRSIYILKMILDETYIKNENNENVKLIEIIDIEAYTFISELILPNKKTLTNYIYQIISNKLNGIDIDKMDYLFRDCYYLGKIKPFDLVCIIKNSLVLNGNVHFSKQVCYDVYQIFRTRYDMHKQFYGHKTVICVNLMIMHIFDKFNNFINLVENFKNNSLETFLNLNDGYILSFPTIYNQINAFKNPIIEEIGLIIKNLNNRNIYKCLLLKNFYSTNKINIDQLLEEHNIILTDKIIIKHHNIGLGGNKNLFDKIYFYDKNNESVILHKDEISYIISSFNQEKIIYVIQI